MESCPAESRRAFGLTDQADSWLKVVWSCWRRASSPLSGQALKACSGEGEVIWPQAMKACSGEGEVIWPQTLKACPGEGDVIWPQAMKARSGEGEVIWPQARR